MWETEKFSSPEMAYFLKTKLKENISKQRWKISFLYTNWVWSTLCQVRSKLVQPFPNTRPQEKLSFQILQIESYLNEFFVPHSEIIHFLKTLMIIFFFFLLLFNNTMCL